MIDWRSTTLGELCDEGGGEIRTGPFGSQLHQSDYSDEGVPVVMPKDIATGRVDEANIARVSPDHIERLAQHKLLLGDIVYGRRGDIGRKALVTEREAGWLCGTGCLRVTVGSSADPRFLFYRLGDPDTVTAIQNRAVGATMPNLNTTILREVELTVPPLETQRRIAAILGAYDDLIEVNRRRVAVLEEMARGLFEEWFVRFRFPGHEQVPLLDTPNGPLPQGWTAQPVGDTFEMLGGGTPSKTVEDYWEGGSVDWYTPTDLTGAKTMFMDRSATRITEAGLAKSSAKLFPADSIMMTSRATIGAIAINTGPACTNQGFITCLPNERVPRSYLLYWLHQNVPVFISHATGATFKEITKGVFKRLPILVPPADLVGRFEGQARPMHDMILALERSTRALAASRDLLLPRLISGQLSVEAAERQLEDAA